MSIPLNQSVKDRLQATKGRWKEFADLSGVSYSWICKFAQGHIPRPGYDQLQKLDAVLPELPAEQTDTTQASA